MQIRVINWDKFQQYKDRNPPWIKLHRSLLDNREWSLMPDATAKALIEIWLVVAETGKSGVIPADIRELAWRLRRDEREMHEILEELAARGFIELTHEAAVEEEPWPSRYIPKLVREAVWARGGGKCAACPSTENIEFDHVIPVSQGGTSTADNLQLLCRPCNRKKRVRSTRYGATG
jgi:hypothetical protein